jgi:hypothetical protein
MFGSSPPRLVWWLMQETESDDGFVTLDGRCATYASFEFRVSSVLLKRAPLSDVSPMTQRISHSRQLVRWFSTTSLPAGAFFGVKAT